MKELSVPITHDGKPAKLTANLDRQLTDIFHNEGLGYKLTIHTTYDGRFIYEFTVEEPDILRRSVREFNEFRKYDDISDLDYRFSELIAKFHRTRGR